MKVGLIGPPMSGKSTLFGAITGHAVAPDYTGQEHLATVKVPEPRLDFLSELYSPKKRTEATIDFVDVPGLSLEGAAQQAEFRRHLPVLRQCDVLVAVVRDFQNDVVPPYRNRIDAAGDLDELLNELVFADLEGVTNRLEKLEQSLKKPLPGKEAEQHRREQALFEQCKAALENEQPLSSAIETEEQVRIIRSFAFLTERPVIAVVNVDEDRAAAAPTIECKSAVDTLSLCAKTEAEIAVLDDADRAMFLEDLGVTESARNRLIRSSYTAAGMISFLTGGEDEVRAWPIPRDSSAVEAASKIHSDIARGFIRAETVSFEDLKATGDMKAAKAAGKVRLEGKQYVVQDGDVIEFRFNV